MGRKFGKRDAILPSLDIIIVNWNSGYQLRECLESIVHTNRSGFCLNRVTVVDNVSTDGSMDGFESLELPLTIIYNIENRVFAAACNQGAKDSNADYLLFLNPDTILFKNLLSIPLHFMEQPTAGDCGIVGVQLLDEKDQISRNCARFPTPKHFLWKTLGIDRLSPQKFQSYLMREWDHSITREVDQVIGAFFLVRRSVFEKIGGFDERFFVYFEEVDFSFRARQDGWSSVYLTDAQAYHKGGGSSEQIKATRLFYSLRSRILYSFKHFNLASAFTVTLSTLLIEFFTRLILAIFNRPFLEVKEVLNGYSLLWRATPKLIIQIIRNGRK